MKSNLSYYGLNKFPGENNSREICAKIRPKSTWNPFTKIELKIHMAFWNLFPIGIRSDFTWISREFLRENAAQLVIFYY